MPGVQCEIQDSFAVVTGMLFAIKTWCVRGTAQAAVFAISEMLKRH